jgi:hypothetical protein
MSDPTQFSPRLPHAALEGLLRYCERRAVAALRERAVAAALPAAAVPQPRAQASKRRRA